MDMEITKEIKEDQALLKLSGEITIYDVSSLKEELLVCLRENNGLDIDFSAVEGCDTAAFQLLCSAVKTARMENKTFKITGDSDALREAAGRVGLNPDFFLNS